MGKKNIQPNSSQPVFRSLVARPALEELREENLTELTEKRNLNYSIYRTYATALIVVALQYLGDDKSMRYI